MKQTLFLIIIFLNLNLFGQKTDIENLINQIAEDEVPEKFKYYFLVPNGIALEKINDSLQNYQIRELKMIDKDFLENFIYTQPKKEIINWKDYNLNKVNYVSDGYISGNYISPPKTKKIKFVKYNICQNKYDSLNYNKEPYTLIIKKKWCWNKNRIWNNKKFYNEFVKNWKNDDINNPEETVYYHFSKPIFSENKKYALVSIFNQKRCDGTGFTALYRNDNGVWKKLMKFNQISSISISTHYRCEDIRYYE